MYTEVQVTKFFDRYASHMNLGLAYDPIDTEWLSQAFAENFIGANPNGIQSGENNEQFRRTIREGIVFYRRLGVRSMMIMGQEVQVLDAMHALVKIQWTCVYENGIRSGEISFVNYYLIQARNPDSIKIFSYVTGDEVKAFREHGLL
jgi:hypothetical protein